MAGMFGLFDYTKPGKGIGKEQPRKTGVARFFEVYVQKFFKFVQLNLLFLLFCIPVITIGPSLSAMMLVLKNFLLERPVFLFSDFWEAFLKNFKKSLAVELMILPLILLLWVSSLYYSAFVREQPLFYLPLALIMSIALLGFMGCGYIFLMIPLLDMKLRFLIKNAIYLAILGIKRNLIWVITVMLLILISTLFFPITLLWVLLLLFSTTAFVVVFLCYPIIDRYIITPYYEKTGEKHPDLPDQSPLDHLVFQDEQE